MKKMFCLLLLSALLCACLAAAAEDGLTDVRCEEQHFSLRVPAGLNAYPCESADWYTDEVFSGGLAISAGGEDGMPQVRVMRRSCFYDLRDYLGGYFPSALEEQYGECGEDGIGTYRAGGRTLYGNTVTVYGEQGEELFRERRLIPAGGDRGTEFIARYTAETETEALSLLDAVIRYYVPDRDPEPAEAKFRPLGHSGEADLLNGTYLLRAEDADRIETDGYFTAVLYITDYYPAADVLAMRPGDTVLIMDRVLTVTWTEADGNEDEYVPYETDLWTEDPVTGGLFHFTMILSDDETVYWAYFSEDNRAASRVGEVRVRVPQPEPVEYVYESEDGTEVLSEDLLGDAGSDPALLTADWNEYTHRCVFEDGRLVRVVTWAYPDNPEDLFASW